MKRYSDEHYKRKSRAALDLLRSRIEIHLAGKTSVAIRQEMGWRKRRWQAFMEGKIDQVVKFEEVYRLNTILDQFKGLNPGAISQSRYRLFGSVKIKEKNQS